MFGPSGWEVHEIMPIQSSSCVLLPVAHFACFSTQYINTEYNM